jgi:hypothetical protein
MHGIYGIWHTIRDDTSICKVRADKKHTNTPRAKTKTKTVFLLALEKKPLAPTGGRGSIYRGYIEHRA